MADRIFDNDPELHDQAEALRQEYGKSNRGDGSNDPPTPDQRDLQEWDAGEDEQPIPPRGWLLSNAYCRRFLSGLIGDGAVGKTALRIAQLLSLAAGRSLTGERVFQRCRVMLVSLEDDVDELRRRVRAAMLHHGIKHNEVKGWFFLAAPKGVKLIEKSLTGGEKAGKLESLLRTTIKKRGIDVVCLDPFVKTHGLDENITVRWIASAEHSPTLRLNSTALSMRHTTSVRAKARQLQVMQTAAVARVRIRTLVGFSILSPLCPRTSARCSASLK